jgi:hypothetical protein
VVVEGQRHIQVVRDEWKHIGSRLVIPCKSVMTRTTYQRHKKPTPLTPATGVVKD